MLVPATAASASQRSQRAPSPQEQPHREMTTHYACPTIAVHRSGAVTANSQPARSEASCSNVCTNHGFLRLCYPGP